MRVAHCGRRLRPRLGSVHARRIRQGAAGANEERRRRRKVQLMWAAAVMLLVAALTAAFAIASVAGASDIVVAPAVLAGAAGSWLIRRALDTDDDAIAIHVAHSGRIGAIATITAALLAAGAALLIGGHLGIAGLVALAVGEGTRRLGRGLILEPKPKPEPVSQDYVTERDWVDR